MSRLARIAIMCTVAAMILAGGLVGYGVGFERGRNDRPPAAEPLPPVRPPSQLGVPNVFNTELEEAAERLLALEFDVGFRQPPAGEGTGRVASTSPDPGTIVERGSLIVVFEERVDGEPLELDG